MAKAKKTAKKNPAPKSKKKAPAAKTTKKKATRKPVVALSYADRQSTLKPPDGFESVVGHTITAWASHSRAVRIDGRSPAQLARVLKQAVRDRAKEDALREKYEEQLRRLVDARMVSSAAAWGQTLDVYRVVKALIPMRPELEEAFSELSDAFARAPTKKEEAGGPAVPAGG